MIACVLIHSGAAPQNITDADGLRRSSGDTPNGCRDCTGCDLLYGEDDTEIDTKKFKLPKQTKTPPGLSDEKILRMDRVFGSLVKVFISYSHVMANVGYGRLIRGGHGIFTSAMYLAEGK